uniref:Secreted protein n=1 Tax=Ascaris lumbricoides TaxID=6252 RepID=A0A0M3IUZ1_ASCLU
MRLSFFLVSFSKPATFFECANSEAFAFFASSLIFCINSTLSFFMSASSERNFSSCCCSIACRACILRCSLSTDCNFLNSARISFNFLS